MNKTVLVICFIVTFIFVGMVSGAAKKNRKQWKKRKAAAMFQTISNQTDAQQSAGTGEASNPLVANASALSYRRQGTNDPVDPAIFDNYDDAVTVTIKEPTWPRHVDDLMYYATTPLPFYTLNSILGIGYHPEITTKSPCEEMYDDWMKRQRDMDMEDISSESESVEMVQVPRPK